MFDGISMSDYVIEFDLQKAYFLRDCLEEEISYELKEIGSIRNPRSILIIYKKSDNGISEEITLDELIFYIHTEVAWKCPTSYPDDRSHPTPQERKEAMSKFKFYQLFKDIDNISKAVRNMEIILKYDNKSSDEENESSDEENESPDDKELDKIIEQIESFEIPEDNESLAF